MDFDTKSKWYFFKSIASSYFAFLRRVLNFITCRVSLHHFLIVGHLLRCGQRLKCSIFQLQSMRKKGGWNFIIEEMNRCSFFFDRIDCEYFIRFLFLEEFPIIKRGLHILSKHIHSIMLINYLWWIMFTFELEINWSSPAQMVIL